MRILFWRKSKKEIPQDILDEFNELERIYAEHNGQMSHQEILFNYYKDKHMNKLHPVFTEEKPINKLETIDKPKSKLNIGNLFKRR